MTHENKTMIVVFATIIAGWIAFALPYPIFSHLFLNPKHGLVSATMSESTRTLLMGIAIALYPLGQIIGSPQLGRWSDRYGRKRVLRLSLWAAFLGSAVLAAGIALGSLPLVFLGRFVSGLGEGNLAIAQSIASDVSTPQTKARNFALIGIAVDAGFIIGPLMGGVLADSSVVPWFSAVVPFWAATGLFAIVAVGAPLILTETSTPRADAPATRPRAILATLRDPRLLPAFVASFLTFWAVMIFFDFFAVYFVQRFHTPPAVLGVYTALISVPLIVTGLFVNRIVNRFGARRVAMAAVAIMAAGILWFILPGEPWALIAPVALVCVGITLGQTATSLMISDAAPGVEQGQALGVYRAITVAAAGLAAIVGGVLAGAAPERPFMTAIVSSAMAVVLLARYRRELPQPRP